MAVTRPGRLAPREEPCVTVTMCRGVCRVCAWHDNACLVVTIFWSARFLRGECPASRVPRRKGDARETVRCATLGATPTGPSPDRVPRAAQWSWSAWPSWRGSTQTASPTSHVGRCGRLDARRPGWRSASPAAARAARARAARQQRAHGAAPQAAPAHKARGAVNLLC